jgi:UDP-N-acetylglucosamine--N-acetylmuramyl-(pentapeptide) pyrophosphoryl-undecaprenol N-acetylglucosamine transferase
MRDHVDSQRIRVAIGAGGTGGHIYPGLAIAAALEQVTGRNADVHFFGVTGRLESTLVPQHGYPLHTNRLFGLRGWRSVAVPGLLAVAAMDCARSLRRLNVDVVLGMGGYPSAPVIVGARLAGIPSLVHESNAVPGNANRLAVNLTGRAALAFDSTRTHLPPKVATRFVGMPLMPGLESAVRGSFRARARQHFDVREGQQLVIVSGGSLGARSLTKAALGLRHVWAGRDDRRVIVKTGPKDLDSAEDALKGQGVVSAVGYLEHMDLAYAAADLMVCRAGAATIAELAHTRVPSILVPYPHASGDHQKRNAEELVQAGGAIEIDDEDLDAVSLASLLDSTLGNSLGLAAMSAAAGSLDRPGAADAVARWVCEIGGYSLSESASARRLAA